MNTDCYNHEKDMDDPSYPSEGGYCKNGEVRVD